MQRWPGHPKSTLAKVRVIGANYENISDGALLDHAESRFSGADCAREFGPDGGSALQCCNSKAAIPGSRQSGFKGSGDRDRFGSIERDATSEIQCCYIYMLAIPRRGQRAQRHD